MAAGWGVFATCAALFFGERIAILRRDFFCRIPILGSRWENYRACESTESKADDED
jgi:hypothetical protein